MPTVLESLNAGLRRAMSENQSVYLLGEDILDPYGGAFKVTRGLSTEFSGRALTTPVSEAGIVGLATGMAIRGLRPVVEIMFGDFVTLIADQLINHAAKFRWVYNDQVRIPLVIRTPMGGRRGYGPTHSQTLEKLFLGIPGMRVLAPSAWGNPGDLLRKAILEDDDPVLFVENKLLYLAQLQNEDLPADFSTNISIQMDAITNEPGESTPVYPLSKNQDAPTYTIALRGAPPATLTLVAYGYMAELARQAILRLAYENEIFVEMLVPTQLAPFWMKPILASLYRTHRLLVAEEGNRTLGWGAEIVARASEALGPDLHCTIRLGGRDTPVPASIHLETAVLPGIDEIMAAAKKLV